MIHSIILSSTMAHRSISLILSTFESILVPRKNSSILQIKAKFSLALIHALILFSSSFVLLARRSAVCKKKQLYSLLIRLKHENTSGVNDPCPSWRIRWLYFRFFAFSVFLWTDRRLCFNPLSANPTKWLNTLKQFVDFCWRNVWVCLTFLWGWRLKG